MIPAGVARRVGTVGQRHVGFSVWIGGSGSVYRFAGQCADVCRPRFRWSEDPRLLCRLPLVHHRCLLVLTAALPG
jgi:hypothetical protein